VSRYALHPGAYDDLDDIRGYIAEDSADAADRLITEIYHAVRALVPFPHQGHKRPDLTSRPLRFINIREYLTAYAPDENPCGLSP
jgi:plasmid stabilization system protein ParE